MNMREKTGFCFSQYTKKRRVSCENEDEKGRASREDREEMIRKRQKIMG